LKDTKSDLILAILTKFCPFPVVAVSQAPPVVRTSKLAKGPTQREKTDKEREEEMLTSVSTTWLSSFAAISNSVFLITSVSTPIIRSLKRQREPSKARIQITMRIKLLEHQMKMIGTVIDQKAIMVHPFHSLNEIHDRLHMVHSD
jgi:hypothetical protein